MPLDTYVVPAGGWALICSLHVLAEFLSHMNTQPVFVPSVLSRRRRTRRRPKPTRSSLPVWYMPRSRTQAFVKMKLGISRLLVP
ncbi:hypothetical protein F5Y14DRAFT_410457 [Nemania sp. NC0429]|nr:hypothetical protein F5Y14DRAFT_410457 [Nemania sp. NC0429]